MRHRSAWSMLAVIGLIIVAACAGCSSSASTPPSSPPPTTPPPTLSSSSSSPTPPPVTTPTTPSSSAKSTPPLSPYEGDPAVHALRGWAAQLAHTINSGKTDDATLNGLITHQLVSTMPEITQGEIGHQYPGPVPFTPKRVTIASSTEHDVQICMVVGGYSLNPKTGKPFSKYKVLPADSAAELINGRWLVSKFVAGSFSCSGVKIAKPSW